MSVLIQEMEMPENCYECPLMMHCEACEGYDNACILTNEDLGWYSEWDGKISDHSNGTHDARHPNCPLRELPDGEYLGNGIWT